MFTGWFKGLLPKSALSVEEEAWNAYPYTKTRYTCPFVEKFSLEIETYYYPDNGSHDNVFKMSQSEVRNVSVGTYLNSFFFFLSCLRVINVTLVLFNYFLTNYIILCIVIFCKLI